MTFLRFNILFFAFLISGLLINFGPGKDYKPDEVYGTYAAESPDQSVLDTIGSLIIRLREELVNSDTSSAGRIIKKIESMIRLSNLPDGAEVADYLFLKGILENLKMNFPEALNLFKMSAGIRVSTGDTININYAKSLFNIGSILISLEYLNESREWINATISTYRRIDGDNSAELVDCYLLLASALQKLNYFSEARDALNRATEVAVINGPLITDSELTNLYSKRGEFSYESADYEEALRNFEIAEDYCLRNKKDINQESYLRILNDKASAYYFLGREKEMEETYLAALKYAEGDMSEISATIIQNYAIFLGNKKRIDEGERLYSNLINNLEKKSERQKYFYYWVSIYYAEYLREYNLNPAKTLGLFYDAYNYYLESNNVNLGNKLITFYALALMKLDSDSAALGIIQKQLFRDKTVPADLLRNPSIDSLRFNTYTLKLLDAKYQVLLDMFEDFGNIEFLKSAASVSELIVSVLEIVRLNISEEDSRILLGDRYRDFYLYAIKSNTLLHNSTGDLIYIDKAFTFGEKSKAAGLLAATRDIRGIQYHIPAELAEYEKEIHQQIGIYSQSLEIEKDNERPDPVRIMDLKKKISFLAIKRDSLKRRFENDYPDYYKLKYNTDVIKLRKVPSVLNYKSNYISYILSDSLLYIMVVNRSNQQIITMPVDSNFFSAVSTFRSLLKPPKNGHMSAGKYLQFQSSGYKLYQYLVAPVEKYLISGKLVISPDNMLSFLPFGAFLSDDPEREDLHFRILPYLIRKYEISYTYSATLLSENKRARASLRNNSIAFAPEYRSNLVADSILSARKVAGNNILGDLPFARDEAKYVADLTSGTLLLGDSATIANYKSHAGDYDLVHLAMHALVNDADPTLSKLIFGSARDSVLTTSDIYGIPLSAKMVVLSACNTGIGTLHRGEGILSLARGFIYSGGQAVVMSLWEVEDKSGTEIVKSFYDNIRQGKSKSRSLRKAKLNFLEDANQLKSHPYFWATLVIYGENSPVYVPAWKKSTVFAVPFLAIAFIVLYLRKRRYS